MTMSKRTAVLLTALAATYVGLAVVSVLGPDLHLKKPPEPVITEQVINVWVGFGCVEEDGSLAIRVSDSLSSPALDGCEVRQLQEMNVEQWKNR